MTSLDDVLASGRSGNRSYTLLRCAKRTWWPAVIIGRWVWCSWRQPRHDHIDSWDGIDRLGLDILRHFCSRGPLPARWARWPRS